jgi:putative aldouronate transport system substrate-binding protein
MRKKGKAVSLILAALLLIGVLAACGQTDGGTRTTEAAATTAAGAAAATTAAAAATTTAAAAADATTTAAAAADATTAAAAATDERAMVGNMYVEGLPIVKEPVNYTMMVPRDAASSNTWAEKWIVQETEKETNVHIEFQETPQTGWIEKVNITLASGNLPDAFAGNDIPDFVKNISMFQEISGYFQYGPSIQEMFADQPELMAGITAPDGKIYSLPTYRWDRSVLTPHVFYYYKPWLEQIGKDVPKTTAEFEEVLKLEKEGDLNGNGKADEVPLGYAWVDGKPVDAMFGAFGVVDNPQYAYPDENDKVIFPAEQPGYYEGLKWMHSLYAAGYFEQELFTMTSDAFGPKRDAVGADRVYGFIASFFPNREELDDWAVLPPLTGPNGDQLWTSNRLPGGRMSGFAITTKAQNPEVLVRWYDNNISSLEKVMYWFYGPKDGGTWKPDASGKGWEETSDFVPEGMGDNEFERTVTVAGNSPAYLRIRFDALRVQEPAVEMRIAGVDEFLEPHMVKYLPTGLQDTDDATEIALLFADIESYMARFKANAIVEGIDDAQWQAHLAALKQLRVDEYIALYQKYYDLKKDSSGQ